MYSISRSIFSIKCCFCLVPSRCFYLRLGNHCPITFICYRLLLLLSLGRKCYCIVWVEIQYSYNRNMMLMTYIDNMSYSVGYFALHSIPVVFINWVTTIKSPLSPPRSVCRGYVKSPLSPPTHAMFVTACVIDTALH